jgi:hypothetical protein
MKEKIDRVPYSSLRNDEFPVVYNQTVNICERHDMRSLHLEKSYGELLSFRPQLDSLTVYLRKNLKLAIAGKSETERDVLINTVQRVTKSFEHTELQDIQPHYYVLNALLEKHNARTIAKSSNAAETERLLLLETDVKASPQAQAAITALGLTPVVTRLFEANHEYEFSFRDYITSKSEEQRIEVVPLRRDCSKSIVQFIDAVQYSAYVYEDLDYMPFINELKKLNQYYITQLKARATRRQNGKKTDEEPAIPPMEEA